jgi:hypothetical protein
MSGMKSFAAAITIQARAETVWALLTDSAGYPQWNSTVERVEGRIAAGEKLSVYTKASPARAFPLRVTEFVPPERMTWTGGMPFGLFTGTRRYMLTSISAGQVEFAMREEFGGLLAPLITRSIPDLQPMFETFVADLKRRAERVA